MKEHQVIWKSKYSDRHNYFTNC